MNRVERLRTVHIGLLLPAVLGSLFVWLVGGADKFTSPEWGLSLWFACYFSVVFFLQCEIQGKPYSRGRLIGDLGEVVILYAAVWKLGAVAHTFDGGVGWGIGAIGLIALVDQLGEPDRIDAIVRIRIVGAGLVGVALIGRLIPEIGGWAYYWWTIIAMFYLLLVWYASEIWKQLA